MRTQLKIQPRVDPSKALRPQNVLRETFRLPGSEARRRARELFQIFPSAEYLTQIECCRELPGDVVELTVRWKEDSPNLEDDTGTPLSWRPGRV
jgi:hypothetical protein